MSWSKILVRNPLILSPEMIRHMKVRDRLPSAPRLNVQLDAHEMHWQIIGPDERVVREAEQPIHNLILGQAKEQVATYGFSALNSYAAVGTGSTAPNASQTGLVAEVARTGTVPSGGVDGSILVSDGVYNIQRTKEFTAAQVGGQNLTEWGWSPVSVAGANLMSRELFRDAAGVAISLTLAADQKLRLIYKTRITLGPVVPTAASINITNIGVRTGKVVLSKYTCSSSGYFPPNQADLTLANNFAAGTTNLFVLSVSSTAFVPSYTLNTAEFGKPLLAPTFQAYVANSKQRQTTPFTYSEVVANMTIRSFGLGFKDDPCGSDYYTMAHMFVFDSGQEIVKDSLHKLIFDPWTLSWT